MPTIEERYDQGRIDVLKRYLQREAANGRTKDYEILVDGFKVIPRTRNLDEFDDYEIELRDNTRNLSILVYDGPVTPRNTKYSFRIEKPQETLNGPGNGLGATEQLINDKLAERDRQYELERLKEELADTHKQLEDAEDYHKILEDKLAQAEANKHKISGGIGALGTVILENLVKRNAHLFPGASAFAGLLGVDVPEAPPPTQESQPATEATFQKQDDPPLTQEQMHYLNNLRALERILNRQQLNTIFNILQKLTERPDQIDTVAALLNI